AVARDGGELQPWCADVEQPRDTFSGQHLPAPVEQWLCLRGLFACTCFEHAQLVDEGVHVRAIAREGLAVHIDFGFDTGHDYLSPSFPRKRESSLWPRTGTPLSRGRAELRVVTPAPSASPPDEIRRMHLSSRVAAACSSASRSVRRRRSGCRRR